MPTSLGPSACPTILRTSSKTTSVRQATTTHLRPLRSLDLKTDPKWAFAPIAVLSRWERGTTSYSQARRCAEAFGLPFVRWPLTTVNEETLGLRKEELGRLRAEEPGRL